MVLMKEFRCVKCGEIFPDVIALNSNFRCPKCGGKLKVVGGW